MLKRTMIGVIAMFFCQLGFAGANDAAVDGYFEQLKNTPVNYSNFGSICEQVARLEMMKTYDPNQYNVKVGISYGNNTRTIGELDVIVFRNTDNEAIVVAEVKCWKDMRGGLNKAYNQISRFKSHIGASGIEMHSVENEDEVFTTSQFDEAPRFMTISQKGGESAGYDLGLPLDLEQMNALYARMLQCQERGECPRI